jgi:glycosyltransferase involved in cell wall biosynthesis
MRITVIVCTRNRAEQLRSMLESATHIETPGAISWELLVVDNGSADHTSEIVESFARRLPIRRVSEPTPGLSNARNRGVSEANGEYICWTDDDVLIDPHWLAGYAEAFVRHPEAAYFGGPIELVLEEPTPTWFKRNRALLGPILAERQFGDVPIRFDPAARVIPYGANYAVRAREQRLHTYDPNLGVSPTQRRLGEEITLLAAIHEAGGIGWWVPNARVRHIISTHRQTMEHLAEYRRAAGETAAYLAERDQGAIPGAMRRISAWPFRGAPLLWCLMSGHLVLHRLSSWFGWSSASLRHYLRYSYCAGAISYLRQRDIRPTQ